MEHILLCSSSKNGLDSTLDAGFPATINANPPDAPPEDGYPPSIVTANAGAGASGGGGGGGAGGAGGAGGGARA